MITTTIYQLRKDSNVMGYMIYASGLKVGELHDSSARTFVPNGTKLSQIGVKLVALGSDRSQGMEELAKAYGLPPPNKTYFSSRVMIPSGAADSVNRIIREQGFVQTDEEIRHMIESPSASLVDRLDTNETTSIPER